ncbi:MAG: COR domain-containing protein [Thiofilum sp.]|uniref:COR domain-containing protein n=1 Tax=Thiofilum sp. TaxID=2212733 RepID=UPI0025E66EDA|nr:COR domain-containing protein [Thiofilum sp.]MBK8454247.1 leucine-rich repeat domain-containing protein [Thiofilum sp.]
MSELALRLIRKAKEKRLTSLDLGNCGLTELPDELFELTWLETLILSNEHWFWNDERKLWSQQKSLNHNVPNRFFRIDPKVKYLYELKKLIICGSLHDPWSISEISFLKFLVNLEYLDISCNAIIDLKPLTSLYNLRFLYLSRNIITDISQIKDLKKLETLDLGLNRISNIESISTLNYLENLFISQNKIFDISSLKTLNFLKNLSLNKNLISNIEPITSLENLESISLSNNVITNISPLINNGLLKFEIKLYGNYKSKPQSKTIYLGNNPIKNPPINIVELGNTAILNYFKDLEHQGEKKINEAKLIIIGEPGAGKTSLMKKLINLRYSVPTEEDSTLGIKIEEDWQFRHPQKENINFSTNIWDFGGQQIQYMTHQFFLTPSAVYVLVSANDRKETTANFPYWFKIIHLLGEENGVHSPILVVQNDKNGQFINQFNETYYRERYPELSITTRPVDLKNDDDFKVLRNEIQKLLTSLPHVNEPRPAKWEPIRHDLRELAKTKNHISFDEYAAICKKHEVTDFDSQKLLSYYLHRLGSLLHFADDTNLFDFIILNPQWAVDAVYSVLNDNSIAKNYGYFTYAKLESIWKEKYNATERNKLLTLMKKDNFEICYQVECKENTYIAPQLLNEHRPKYNWNDKDSLKFRFQYQFMPEGIITRLIVRLNDKLDKFIDESGNTCDVVWRKGMVLNHDSCRAQIIEEENNRDGLKTIDIAVTGNTNKRKYLLHLIRTEVESLHKKWFRNIAVEQMIPCICAYCTNAPAKDRHYFKFSVLQRAQEKHKKTVECEKEFLDVPVLALLEGIFEKTEINNMQGGERFMTQVSHHYHGNATVHNGDNHQSGNTVTAGENSMVAIGHNITQKLNSDNTTTTITTDQRKIIGQIIEEVLKNKGTMSDDDLEVIIDARRVLRADEKQSTPETQGKLARFWSALQANTDFANNVLGVAGALGASTAITGYLPFIVESVKSIF